MSVKLNPMYLKKDSDFKHEVLPPVTTTMKVTMLICLSKLSSFNDIKLGGYYHKLYYRLPKKIFGIEIPQWLTSYITNLGYPGSETRERIYDWKASLYYTLKWFPPSHHEVYIKFYKLTHKSILHLADNGYATIQMVGDYLQSAHGRTVLDGLSNQLKEREFYRIGIDEENPLLRISKHFWSQKTNQQLFLKWCTIITTIADNIFNPPKNKQLDSSTLAKTITDTFTEIEETENYLLGMFLPGIKGIGALPDLNPPEKTDEFFDLADNSIVQVPQSPRNTPYTAISYKALPPPPKEKEKEKAEVKIKIADDEDDFKASIFPPNNQFAPPDEQYQEEHEHTASQLNVSQILESFHAQKQNEYG